MARRLPVVLLSAAALAGLVAGCGSTTTAAPAAAPVAAAAVDTSASDLAASCTTVAPLLLAYRDGAVPAKGADWSLATIQGVNSAMASVTANLNAGMRVPNAGVYAAALAASAATDRFLTDSLDATQLQSDVTTLSTNLADIDRACP